MSPKSPFDFGYSPTVNETRERDLVVASSFLFSYGLSQCVYSLPTKQQDIKEKCSNDRKRRSIRCSG